jgi:hypothetical protein
LGAKLPWYKAGEVVETDGLVPDRIDPAEVTLGFPVLGALQIAGGCAKVAVMSRMMIVVKIGVSVSIFLLDLFLKSFKSYFGSGLWC